MNYNDYLNNHGADYCTDPAESIIDRREFIAWGDKILPLDLTIDTEYPEDSVGYFKDLTIDFNSAELDLAEKLERIDTLWTQLRNHGFRVYRNRGVGDESNVLTCPLQIEETYDIFLVSTMLMELNHWEKNRLYIHKTLEEIANILYDLEFYDTADWVWSLCEKDITTHDILVRHDNDDVTEWKEVDNSIAYMLFHEIDENNHKIMTDNEGK